MEELKKLIKKYANDKRFVVFSAVFLVIAVIVYWYGIRPITTVPKTCDRWAKEFVAKRVDAGLGTAEDGSDYKSVYEKCLGNNGGNNWPESLWEEEIRW